MTQLILFEPVQFVKLLLLRFVKRRSSIRDYHVVASLNTYYNQW